MIWGDDVGWWNPSCYNNGMMGFQTPNMDRIAAEGARFQAWYGENSCTAGRAAFITGQSPIRTGLTKVGLPGATLGLQPEDPTIAELLKPLGYATGQFGKNHLGDLNKYLPTVHGFDEFYGFLYHLNAFDEPESPNYPSDPAFLEKYGPRGVLHCFATDVDDPTVDPRFGPVGKQTIEDTGPLTIERQGTIDDEIVEKSVDFIRRAVADDKPFFVWHNAARMHMHTHLKPESQGVTGLGVEADGMVEHDGHVGQLLDLVDELGITGNTMVMYSTDNGASFWSWPDAGTTPFRSEKDTVWEGGFRVPCMIRWPGVIEPGTVSNDFYSMTDMLPTILAAAGNPDVPAQLLSGLDIEGVTYKVYIDGYNLLPYWTGQVSASPRTEFYYWDDDGGLGAIRYGRWKQVLLDQRAHGRQVWIDPPVELRIPYLFDLLADPFEKAQLDSTNYNMWVSENAFIGYPV
ncbi:MAG: arylsulfatase, partial [Chloroflexota bacterium]